MKMMNILITGGNGFLGRHVVSSLLEQGNCSVRCLVRHGSQLNGLPEDQIQIVRGSLNNPQDIKEALKGIDTVIHLAASMGGSPMGMFIETVVSTEILMSALSESPVDRFVFCSSFSVYGASELKTGSIFDENCPIEPNPKDRDAYAWCKYYQELWVKENVHSKTDLAIIRPGVIYGEDKGLLGPRIGLRLPGIPIFLQIGSNARLPLTHVQNCADAIACAGLSPNKPVGTFNIVDDECPTQKQYVKEYEKHFGTIPKRIVIPYRLFLWLSSVYWMLHKLSKGNLPPVFSSYKAKSMYRRFNFSNQKAKKELGWTPKVSLQDGLAQSYQAPDNK
jgi:nucleoside-diphosphate-sugar epimerase